MERTREGTRLLRRPEPFGDYPQLSLFSLTNRGSFVDMLDCWYKFGNFGVKEARSHQVVQTKKTDRALGGRGDKILNLGFGVQGLRCRVSGAVCRV